MAHGDITHIDIPVGNLESGASFYGSVFGWQISAPPGFEGYPMWQAPNKISGGGLVSKDSLATPLSYVEVDSIDDTLATVQAQGGTVVAGKQPISDTSWFAVFSDPDGNQIGLYEGVTAV